MFKCFNFVTLVTPREMTETEIQDTIKAYGEATKLADMQ